MSQRGWYIVPLLAVAGAVLGTTSPAWACQTILWPSMTFRGSVQRVDEDSSTATLQIDEVVSTEPSARLSVPPVRETEPIDWPAPGATIRVGYPPGEVGALHDGDRYEVTATKSGTGVVWQSTAFAWYSTEPVDPMCGAEQRAAGTRFVDGSTIENPARTFARSSMAKVQQSWPPFVVAGAAAVMLMGAGILAVRRTRRRSRTASEPEPIHS